MRQPAHIKQAFAELRCNGVAHVSSSKVAFVYLAAAFAVVAAEAVDCGGYQPLTSHLRLVSPFVLDSFSLFPYRCFAPPRRVCCCRVYARRFIYYIKKNDDGEYVGGTIISEANDIFISFEEDINVRDKKTHNTLDHPYPVARKPL